MFRLLLIVGILCLLPHLAAGQATQPGDDAATLYLQAGSLLENNNARGIWPPSSSEMNYSNYPPFPEEWQRMEKADYAANAQARALAHQARSNQHENGADDRTYLDRCRALSNELADAALYEHLQKDDAAAIETLRDLLHLADLLENQTNKKLVRLLVSIGIRARCMDHLEVITSGVALTKNPFNGKDLRASVARELVGQLLKHQDAKTIVDESVRAEAAEGKNIADDAIVRVIEVVNRANAERDMAAMSLACHLYRFDTGNWPKSLDDLHGYLPKVPIDPWGDGKQTLGYALIKGGLPDGSPRPLVYSRCGLKDGLFFRIDQPQ